MSGDIRHLGIHPEFRAGDDRRQGGGCRLEAAARFQVRDCLTEVGKALRNSRARWIYEARFRPILMLIGVFGPNCLNSTFAVKRVALLR